MEQDFAATHRLQLGERLFVRARLADLMTVVSGDLIGADHQRLVLVADDRCNRPRLGLCQPQCSRSGGFARERRFVDGGRNDIERDAQAFEQFTPVAGAGRQNQAGWVVKGIRMGKPAGEARRAKRCTDALKCLT